MKTSGLKKIVEDNDGVFKNNVDDAEIYIYHKCENVGDINKNRISEVNLYSCPKVVAQAIVDYAFTPLVEREEEKRYILIFPSCFDEFKYLNFNNITKKYGRSMQSFVSLNDVKTIFTQKEIDAMPFDTNFFIKEEVQ